MIGPFDPNFSDIITIIIRIVLALSTLTIEPMMFLWSVAGGMVKVSQEQMIMYKVIILMIMVMMMATR